MLYLGRPQDRTGLPLAPLGETPRPQWLTALAPQDRTFAQPNLQITTMNDFGEGIEILSKLIQAYTSRVGKLGQWIVLVESQLNFAQPTVL